MDKNNIINFTIIEHSNREDLLLLQTELPGIKVLINERPDFSNYDGDTHQIAISLYTKFIDYIDSAVIAILVDRLYKYLTRNEGDGKIKVTIKEVRNDLDAELLCRKPTKEELLSQITQFTQKVKNNMPKEERYISENETNRKITFYYDEKSKLILPYDYQKSKEDLEKMLGEMGKWKN